MKIEVLFVFHDLVIYGKVENSCNVKIFILSFKVSVNEQVQCEKQP